MDRKVLVKTLDLASGALAKQDLIPIYKCFAFRDGKLIAFNDQVGITTPCDMGLETVLHGQTLIGLLRNTQSEEVEFSVDGEDVVVKGGRSTFKLPWQPIEDYNFTEPDGPWDVETTLTNDFLIGLELCLTTASRDNTQPAFQGVSINSNKLYSSDGDAISEYTLDEPVGSTPYMIHNSFCETLLSLIAEVEDHAGALTLNKEWVCASLSNGYKLYGRLIENESPVDFEGQIKRTIQGEPDFVAIPDGLKDALARARVVADVETAKTTMTIDKGKMMLLTNSSLGVVKDTLPFKHPTVTADVSAMLTQRSIMHCDKMHVAEAYCAFASDKLFVLTGNM